MQQTLELPCHTGGTAGSQCRRSRRLAGTSSARGSASSIMASTWATEKSSIVGRFPAFYPGGGSFSAGIQPRETGSGARRRAATRSIG